MKLSDNGLNLVKKWEGRAGQPVLQAYQDVVGVWTNGYGNTHGVVPGSVITLEQAIADLIANTGTAQDTVNRVVRVPLTQNQFDACVDLAFNIGNTAFANSTLVRKLNSKDYAGAALEFAKWNKAGGKVVQGLVNRRADETKLFNTK